MKSNNLFFNGMLRAVLLCAALILPGHAQSFAYSSQSAIYDKVSETIAFTINFLEPPDFYTKDEFGRSNNAFQYYIWGDLSLPYPEFYDSIVRGEELTAPGDKLIIRDTNGSTEPGSGGWGDIRGMVDYVLAGSVFSFTAPVALLSDHGPYFFYQLGLYENGVETSNILYRVTDALAVPEPAGIAVMLAGLVLLWGSRKKSRSWSGFGELITLRGAGAGTAARRGCSASR